MLKHVLLQVFFFHWVFQTCLEFFLVITMLTYANAGVPPHQKNPKYDSGSIPSSQNNRTKKSNIRMGTVLLLGRLLDGYWDAAMDGGMASHEAIECSRPPPMEIRIYPRLREARGEGYRDNTIGSYRFICLNGY